MTWTPKPDFERYMTALGCEQPDRVPLGDWYVDQMPKESFLGKKLINLQDEVDFWYTAGFDYVTVYTRILQPFSPTEALAESVHTEYGEKVTRRWAPEHEGIITNWEQFEKYRWPTVDELDLSLWDALDQILPPGMKAILLLGNIYTPVWMFMGAETFFNTLETNEELVAAMFDKVGKTQYDLFLRIAEHPCLGAVLNPDDLAHNTGLFIHPKYFRKYLFPWYKKIAEICREKGLGFVLHSDGDCSEVMEDLINCGFQGLNPVQPNCMDIDELKRRWGDRVCLIGNINLNSTLTLGTPEDVRAEVYERIRTVGPAGGYMVASSNSISDFVPLQNMKAMIDATFEFGRYPIELEEGGITGRIYSFQPKPKVEEKAYSAVELDVDAYESVLLSNNISKVIELVQKDIDSGVNPLDIVGWGMIPAMTSIGKKFQNSEIYIPELIISARAMSSALNHFKDKILVGSHKQQLGSVVIGTVKGDLHDIGKNLVILVLDGQGFRVEDLGISVSPDRFVQAVNEKNPDIVAISALLTTTMIEMKNTIDVLTEAGLRDKINIIVGGAPVTQQFADQIGADGYAYDAPGAAEKCKELFSE